MTQFFPSDSFLREREITFLCLDVHRKTWIYGFGPDAGSLINQQLFLDPIRTVFNYSANFNVIEETGRKQLVSPKQLAKQSE